MERIPHVEGRECTGAGESPSVTSAATEARPFEDATDSLCVESGTAMCFFIVKYASSASASVPATRRGRSAAATSSATSTISYRAIKSGWTSVR